MSIYDTSILLPSGIECHLKGTLLTIKGSKGSIDKTFYYPSITLTHSNNTLLLSTKLSKPNKNIKMYINTFAAHINNMIHGVQHPYKATLKVCSGHFPITVTSEGQTVVVKNFLGEKSPRKAFILPGAKVIVQGDQITVEGVDIDAVSQTAARIEQSTRITNRDRRIFQDGCYITLKAGEKNE